MFMFKAFYKGVFLCARPQLRISARKMCVRGSQVLIITGAVTLTHAEGDEYIGDEHKGLKHGQGSMTYSDGSAYLGGWKAGQKDGDGTLFTSEGTVMKGMWWKQLKR